MERARGRRRRKERTRMWLWGLIAIGAFALALFAGFRLYSGLRVYSDARDEYDYLKKYIAPAAVTGEEEEAPATQEDAPAAITLAGPADINGDYVGWLTVSGTDISYPIVQGEDNDKYLNTTFLGKENKLGAIFLDYRCVGAFSAPHAIVYGHNAKDKSMFGALAGLLGSAAYPDITVTLRDGTALVYRIFAVRETDIYDHAYRLDFADDAEVAAFAAELGAPDGGRLPDGGGLPYETARLLTLSTCIDGAGKDARLLVLAERVAMEN